MATSEESLENEVKKRTRKELADELIEQVDGSADAGEVYSTLRSLAARDLADAVEPDDKKFFFAEVRNLQKEIIRIGSQEPVDPDDLFLSEASFDALSWNEDTDEQ